jgi:glucosamine--fructose-6-phosphate aminotransferase (isomerizing)
VQGALGRSAAKYRAGASQAILDILPAQLLAAELSDAASLTDTKFRYRMSETKVPEPSAA